MAFDLSTWMRVLAPDAGGEPLPPGPPKLAWPDLGSEPAPPGPPK